MLVTAIKTGFIKALKTAAMLLKVVIPVYTIVVIISNTPLFSWMQDQFAPFMKYFGLPGDAIIPIVAGLFTDEYGAIAALKQIELNTAQLTTVAMIVLVCHTIPVESAIARKIGIKAAPFIVFRFVCAILAGLLTARIGGLLL